MNWDSVTFDWNQARAFLATAEEGTLSAAARALRLTQPTLSRQVAALEESLGVALFERVGKSLILTQPGLELLEHTKAMGEAAARVSLSASGQSQAIEGKVSITASDLLSAYHLPDILRRLRQDAPGIFVELIVSNDIRDLRLREADIAIRHVRPDQPELIAKKIGEVNGGLYAMSGYLDRIGRPATLEELSHAEFIGYSDIPQMIAILTEHGLPLTEQNFIMQADNGIVVAELMKRDLGITALTDRMAAKIPGIEPVLPDLIAIPVPIWLTAHRELHNSRRIRTVFDFLAKSLS